MTAPEPVCEPVVCGHRVTNTTGNWECVAPFGGCDGKHYLVRLVSKPAEEDE